MRPAKRRRSALSLLLALAVGLGGLAVAPVPPAAARQPAAPFLSDGRWSGSLGASGPFSLAGVEGVVSYGGSFEMEVWEGAVTGGTWQIAGSGLAVHTRASGSVSYIASGLMTGVAAMPEMLPEGAVITYDLVVNGVPVSGTDEMGPEYAPVIYIPLLTATCDLAIGNWNLPANMMYSGAGGSSDITGSWTATREGGSELAGQSSEEVMQALDSVMARARDWAGTFYLTGEIDFDALNALANEAEWFNQRLNSGGRCGGQQRPGWVNPIGGTILGLLNWALDNPQQFNNATLLRLVSAAVRAGVMGSRAPASSEMDAIRARLILELISRAEQARQDRNCADAAVVRAAADTLGDPLALDTTGEVVAEVCS